MPPWKLQLNINEKNKGPQVFQRSRHYLKILGTKRVTRSKFHSKDLEMLGAAIQI